VEHVVYVFRKTPRVVSYQYHLKDIRHLLYCEFMDRLLRQMEKTSGGHGSELVGADAGVGVALNDGDDRPAVT
jgi:hypothetical protein